MIQKTIDTCCGITLAIQGVCFVVVQYGAINPWFFPFPLLWLTTSMLGGIVATFSVCLLIREKLYGRSIRAESIVICTMNLIIVVFLQVSYGYQNVDLQEGNDYSTDIVDAPSHQLTTHERMTFKEASDVWGFLAIPHKIRKADLDSIILPASDFDSTLIVKKAISRMGWLLRRHSDVKMTDGSISETYTFKAGFPTLYVRADVVVRIVSNQSGYTTVDIRSSSSADRRDWGMNNLIIKTLAEEIKGVARNYSPTDS